MAGKVAAPRDLAVVLPNMVCNGSTDVGAAEPACWIDRPRPHAAHEGKQETCEAEPSADHRLA